MTNHIPNDLSHLSDAEFNSLCPQGEHAPGSAPLSPAAQAILDAYGSETGDIDCVWHSSELKGLAAVLRAAADQVISPVSPPCEDFNEYDQGFLAAHIKYRAELFAIADELENS
jgi:hypothetical protein